MNDQPKLTLQSGSVANSPAANAPAAADVLELYELSEPERAFKKNLDRKMVGQPKAKQLALEAYRAYLNPVGDRNRPIFVCFLLGPTGVGKTLLAQLLAEEFHGSREAMIRVNCSNYKHHSDMTRLFGAGPKWVGYKDPKDSPPDGVIDNSARLSPHNIIASRRGSKTNVTVVLLDEFEKGCDELQQAFLSIFDNGKEHMANNVEVDFTRCIFLCTSNLSMAEAERQATQSMGFIKRTQVNDERNIESIVDRAWQDTFSPEFRNRVDMKVIYSALSQPELRAVLEVEIGLIKETLERTLKPKCFELCVDDSAKEFLFQAAIKEGGARSIKRVLNKHLSRPIGTSLINKFLKAGHRLTLKHYDGAHGLTFERSGDGRDELAVVHAGQGRSGGGGQAVPAWRDPSLAIAESDRFSKWANSYRNEKRYEEALHYLQVAFTLLEPFAGSQQLRRAGIYNQMANLYWTQNQFVKALPCYQAALCLRLQSTTPDNVAKTPGLFWIYSNLVRTYDKCKLKADAERIVAEGIEAVKRWPSSSEEGLNAIAALLDDGKQLIPSRAKELDELLQAIKDGKYKPQ